MPKEALCMRFSIFYSQIKSLTKHYVSHTYISCMLLCRGLGLYILTRFQKTIFQVYSVSAQLDYSVLKLVLECMAAKLGSMLGSPVITKRLVKQLPEVILYHKACDNTAGGMH